MDNLRFPTDANAATILAVAGAVAAVTLLTSKPKTSTSRIREPASTLPVFGNVFRMAASDMHDWVASECVTFNGEPWRLRIPGAPDSIVLSSPDAVEAVTITHLDNFPKGKYQHELVSTMFGHGLITSDGERWYHQRKTASRFFSANAMKAFLKQSVHKSVGRCHDVLDASILEGKAVDLKKIFHDFTLDTFVEMALGVDLNCVSSKEKHIFQASLETASPITSRRFSRPVWYWKLERWLGVGPEGELKRCMDAIYTWLHEVVQQSIDRCMRQATDEDAVTDAVEKRDVKSKSKSVVELFFEMSKDGMEGIQQDDLVDFVLTLVIAARDTTADTLSWLFFELAKRPEIEAKIRDEMASALADFGPLAYLTADHTRLLVYLEATIKETIRLHPAAPYTFREATEDVVICGDIPIRKGEQIGLTAYGMARLPKLWGEDAAEFKPERWIDATMGEIKQFSATHFMAFSAGPRACIGMKLALLELRAVAANLLHSFTFKMDFDRFPNDGSYVVSPTLTMKNPLMAYATRV